MVHTPTNLPSNLSMLRCLSRQDGDSSSLASHPPVLMHISLPQARSCLRKEGSWQSKVWFRLLRQCPQNISDVVLRLDTLLKRAIPALEDPFDDLDTCEVYVRDRRQETALVIIEQVVQIRLSEIGTVEVRSSSHDDNPAEISEIGI